MTHDDILRAIDDATAPNKMGKREALDFIEQLITDLEFRCEALAEELKAE